MNNSPETHPPSPFLGWRMVRVAFFVDFIAVGFFFYSYSVFFKALSNEFGGSRLEAALGLTVANIVGALLSPKLGRILDQLPIKFIMSGGAVTVSCGFVLLSLISAQWQFYLILGTFIAFGTTAMGGLASSKLVANWFIIKRGTALGVATMGISLSGLIMPMMATWLIENLSWRGAFLAYGAGTFFLVSPIALFFVVSRPEDINQSPDNIPPLKLSDTPRPQPTVPAHTTVGLLKTPLYWQVAFAFALILACLSPILTNMVPYATDRGLSPYEGAAILSFCAGTGVLGKVIFGFIFDRYHPKIALLFSVSTQLCGLLLLMRCETFFLFAVSASLFGFGMGGVVPLQGALIGRIFGRDSFGKTMGLLRPTMLPIHIAGLPLSNYIFDLYGSYEKAFYLFIAGYALALLLITTLKLNTTAENHPAYA